MHTEKLNSLCHINSGGTPSRKNDSFYGGDILWAKIGDIEKSDGVIFDTQEKITEEGLKNIRNRIFPTGTLFFAMYGSVGKVAFAGKEMSTNQAILGIRIKDEAKEILNLEYLKFWFEVNLDFLKNRAVGGILKNLSATIVKDFDIPLPSIKNQLRIVQVLSTCKGLVNKRIESIDLFDELLRSTFLEMFGDPVRNEKNWNIVELSKFGQIDRGVSKHRPRNAPKLLNGIHPLIQTGDVSNSGTYIEGYTRTYSDIGLAQSKKWSVGTLCITIAANIAKTGILTFEACFPDSIVGFVVNKDEATNLYVHHLFTFFQRILEKNAPSAAQKNINLSILRSFKVPQPPIELQLEFDEISKKIEAVKKYSQGSLKELESLYGSVSQKAFNGELNFEAIDIRDKEIVKKKDKKTMSEEKKDITFMSLADYFGIPEDIQAEQENIELTFINDERFYQFFLKKYFKDKSFLIEDIESLFNRIYIPEGVDFDYETWKEFIFNSLKSERPIIEQFFDDSEKIKQIKLKLTDEAFKA